jgi:uncharacterized protein (DUF1800 family)
LEQRKLQHLFLRAGFGETPDNIHALLPLTREEIVEQLFLASKDYKGIAYLPYPLKENQYEKGVNVFQLVSMILNSKKDLEELNGEWLFKMAYTKAVLREKMTFFWHNHFSTSAPFAYIMQAQNNTLRKNALGKFSDLLHAVSKDPAMILYLNNQENKKNHPNENFAREVMELFSLGEGNYLEKDIKEAARAFTGWTVNMKGEYEFKELEHDKGGKTFFGKTGNFNGEDIVNMILNKKQTALYITGKIYQEFVNPKLNKERVEELAESFYQSGYDISGLMKKIFLSDWFYDEENIGIKICSPVELLVRYKKLLSLEFESNQTLIDLQNALGQTLFFPPNVAGWKGGTNWIHSTALLLRLNLPGHILSGEGFKISSKPAFEEKNEMAENSSKAIQKKLKADWSSIENFFKNQDQGKLTETVLTYFIQCSPNKIDKQLFPQVSNSEGIAKICAHIMSLPEFQLI